LSSSSTDAGLSISESDSINSTSCSGLGSGCSSCPSGSFSTSPVLVGLKGESTALIPNPT